MSMEYFSISLDFKLIFLCDFWKISKKKKEKVFQSLYNLTMVQCPGEGTPLGNKLWTFLERTVHLGIKQRVNIYSPHRALTLFKGGSLASEKLGRPTMLAKELSSLRDQREQLKAEVKNIKTNKVAKEAANRWTDNIFAVRSWAKRKFGFEENKIDKNFGIPEDFDYID
ncbi:unnamed protein product [Nyctereutes procyonoides]|uniref:(raccoon dog) hypothetical protein n=1 Tax=Nyctereutes procyonoides TaxID=34880 RepID=A0A811ZPK1_NYCPR|nr:unnamed protein product [Nyctereutes procyonoides]